MANFLTPGRRPLPLPPQQARQRRRARRVQRLLWMLRGIECVAALLGVAWVCLALHVWQTPLPDAWFAKGTLSLQLLDRDGAQLHEQPAPNGRFGSWLPDEKLPRNLTLMTLAAEDHRIYLHPGVDPWAVLRACAGNFVLGKRRSGASTLAMQLARLLKPAPRTYANKLREMVWALILQHKLGPNGVLREYLNRAPYGNRVQGVQRASILYFDRPAADLGLGQAAFLAALPWGPGLLNPFHKRGKRLAWKRARRILHRAHALGLISKAALDDALRDPIAIEPAPRRANSAIHLTQRISRAWKRQLAKQRCGPNDGKRCREALTRQINAVITTLDLPLQRTLQRALQKRRKGLDGVGVGAAVVLDHRNGEVLAYVGSHDYFDKKNCGAIDYTQAPRAPGSTLKPLIYALAMQSHGYTGATLLEDLATTYMWRHGAYIPRNHDTRFLGPLRLRVALGNSRNIPVLRVLSHIGVDDTIDFLRSLGLHHLKQESSHYGLGLALGSAEVSLLSLVRAYGILARRGKPLALRWIKQAYDSLGRPQRTSALAKKLLLPALSEAPGMRGDVAQMILHILADPIARLPSFGRFGMMEFPYPVAVKTGTSQGHRDAWMIAVSDRLVVGCWLGNHDRRKMGRVYGSKGCGPIVQQAMSMAMKRAGARKGADDFEPPASWKQHRICTLSGLPAGAACPRTTEEWLPPGHASRSQKCTFHRHIHVDRRNGLLAGPRCQASVVTTKMAVSMPPQFATWVKAMGLPTVPRAYSPMCKAAQTPKAQQRTGLTLKIKQPAHRSRFVIDPTIPKEYATLSLKAISAERVDTLDWYVNGKKVGRVGWPYAMRWPMRRGRFHIVATTKDGQHRSAPVTVEIQ